MNEFRDKKTTAWVTRSGERAGDVRSAGQGNYTYVAVDDSGHMMPMDHGDWAVDLIQRYVRPAAWYYTLTSSFHRWVFHERLDTATDE